MSDSLAEPVIVTAVRRLDTGSGDKPLPQTTYAETPDHLPNVIIQTITPIVSIGIRSGRVFLQVVLGLLSAKMVGAPGTEGLPAGDFMHLLRDCAGLAVGAACVCALQNAGELLAKLDQKFPMFISWEILTSVART